METKIKQLLTDLTKLDPIDMRCPGCRRFVGSQPGNKLDIEMMHATSCVLLRAKNYLVENVNPVDSKETT